MKGKLEIEFEYESVGKVMELMTNLSLLSEITLERVVATFYDSDGKSAMTIKDRVD